MTQLDRRHLLAGLGVLGLSACSDPFEIGTGKKTPKGGIGGTGIVGTLTDFGSLLVNGLRVETDAATDVTDAFGTAKPEALAVGQNLTIEAATVDGVLIARRVRIVHPVIGTVERVDPSGLGGVVAGATVILEEGAIGELSPGARVAVSGAWRDTTVIASRIDARSDNGPSVISGAIRQAAPGAPLTLAGVPIATGSKIPDPGTFVTATGLASSSGLLSAEIIPGRFTGAAGPLVDLSVEGYLEPAPTAPFYTVSGLGHSFDAAAKLAGFRDQRSVFSGSYEGTFVVQDALKLPETLPGRRQLLGQIANDLIVPETVSAR